MSTLFQIIDLVLLFVTAIGALKSKDELQLALAKRSLLNREHNYLQIQPMSEDLKKFIAKHHRRKKEDENIFGEKRKKRSEEIDENLLYMIKNGQLVPFKSVKDFNKRNEDKKDEGAGYTVVPLIIPVNLRASEIKHPKTRTANEEVPKDLAAGPSTMSTNGPLPGGASSSLAPDDMEHSTVEDEENSDNNTKEETQVLHKILEDVEGLMQWKHDGNKKEGVICNLNGSWISDAAGMRFDICYENATRKKFRIHVADRIPPNEDGFLCDGNWTVFGELPFLHSGMIIALAVHEKDKHIATFIGECRICEGSETVTGTWLLGRSSRDCKDQKAAHKVLSDIWKREQGHTLRKKHLQQIGYSVRDDED